MASSSSSSSSPPPASPLLSLTRRAFSEGSGPGSPEFGEHSPVSSGPSPVSPLRPLAPPEREVVASAASPPPPTGPLALDEEDQGVLALAAGRYRPKDWATDPLPDVPPADTLSG